MMNAIPAEKNFGDPTSAYPNAADIPEVKMDTMQKPGTPNPVVDAFQTIMQYVQALEQRNAPNAGAVKEQLTGLVQAIVSSGDSEQSQDGKQPEEGSVEAPASVDSAKPQEAKMGFDPFKDASSDAETAQDESGPKDEMEMMKKKKMMMGKKNMEHTIQPLA